ncbi:hypothetical protein TSMEX_010411 [Taenia solium]|eukprot:TsM_001168800 transcript=TsM_001168800 gene=TsM_001168800
MESTACLYLRVQHLTIVKVCLVGATLEGKQTKSDKAASDLMCDVAIADSAEVSADDFVEQITLIDVSYVAGIKRSQFLLLK